MEFYSCYKTDKRILRVDGFQGHYFKIRNIFMDFEPCFGVHNLISVQSKSIKLGQITNLYVIFHVVVSVKI